MPEAPSEPGAATLPSRTITQPQAGTALSALLCLAMSAAFIVFATMIGFPKPESAIGWLTRAHGWFMYAFWWFGGIFSGLGALVFIGALIMPPKLMLDAQGFTIEGGLIPRTHRIAWQDVEKFFVHTVRGHAMIGLNFAPHATKDRLLFRLNRKLGAEGGLPLNFGSRDVRRIVDELNAYRQQALAAQSSAPFPAGG